MANKKFIIAIVIGFSFTLGASFIPQYIDPLIRHAFSWSSSWDRLHVDDEIVVYLRSVQYNDDVVIGLHGYRHVSPVDNSDKYEFWDPKDRLTDDQLKMRVDSSTKIFSDVGMTEYLFVPPGNMADERVWNLFEEKGFQVIRHSHIMVFSPNFSKTKLERLEKMGEGEGGEGGAEYTWYWRNMKSFGDPRYAEAVQQVEKEKPILIVLHQQDLNQYTSRFLRELPYHPEFIRCDDFTLETEKAKEVVEIARLHNAVAILSVIPSFVPSGSLFFQIWNEVYHSMFLVFFMFPSAIFQSWYAIVRRERSVRNIGRVDRKKNIVITLSTLATVVSIYLFTRLGPAAMCVNISVVSGCLIGWKLGETKCQMDHH